MGVASRADAPNPPPARSAVWGRWPEGREVFEVLRRGGLRPPRGFAPALPEGAHLEVPVAYPAKALLASS